MFQPDASTSHLGRRTGAYDDLTTIADVFKAWPEPGRHPIIRTGEREPIPAHIRSAVWFRDNGKCELCSCRVEGPWHLDHIVPWSAGGADDTTNLRVLCERHNLERSNYVDPTERPRRAATWWCQLCYDRDGFDWEYANHVPMHCKVHGPLGISPRQRCAVARGYFRMFELTGEMPTWHEREPLTEFHTVAYCAHCDAPALTGVVL
jgi:hypothetical protein